MPIPKNFNSTTSTSKVCPSDCDLFITNAHMATFSEAMGFEYRQAGLPAAKQSISHNPYGVRMNAAIAIKDGKIVWIGDADEPVSLDNLCQVYDAHGKWMTPGLIDCHTHLVYAGNRSNEFEARLQGVSYEQISKQGGGIMATVTATRQASQDALLIQSEKRLNALLAEGVTTLEIKSGYGLDLATERKILQTARKLGQKYGITVKTTYLAAHALPVEAKDDADGYISKVCDWMETLKDEGLIDAVDGFCEGIGFSKDQIERVFVAAKRLGLPVKLHAEQLSDLNGSALVAQYQGLSSDHLEYLSEYNIKLMSEARVVAVLLPGAFYTLKETKIPPIESMQNQGIRIALSTDCNPGTSPLTSMLLTLNMGCTLFGLTPEQALAGVTINAAHALGLQSSKGQIAVGMDADLVLWDIERLADLAYQMGFNPIEKVILGGDNGPLVFR